MSLRERILSYYRKHPGTWISGGEIERLVALRTKYKSSNASRRLREMREDGDLISKEVNGTVFYCYQPKEKQITKVKLVGDKAIEYTEMVVV